MRTSPILGFLASLATLVSASTLCSNDNQCASGLCFDGKVCSDCHSASDCPADSACSLNAGNANAGGVCYPPDSDPQFLACAADSDCTMGRVCLPNGACSNPAPFQLQFCPLAGCDASPSVCLDFTDTNKVKLASCVLNSPTQLMSFVSTAVGPVLANAAADLYLTNSGANGAATLDDVVMYPDINLPVLVMGNQLHAVGEGEENTCLGILYPTVPNGLSYEDCQVTPFGASSQFFQVYVAPQIVTIASSTAAITTAATTASSTAATTASSTGATTASSTAATTASSTAATTASSTAATTESSTTATFESSTAATTASSTDVTTASSTAATTASSTDATTATASTVSSNTQSNAASATTASASATTAASSNRSSSANSATIAASAVGSSSPKASDPASALNRSASFTSGTNGATLAPSDTAVGGVTTATTTLAYGYMAPGSVPTTGPVKTGRNLYVSGGDVVHVAMGVIVGVVMLAL
ncbi:hypothetical protein HDU98_003785 [Podochytrium sp. JEL0797]|nr:hypothetical protein HDU98_003785 [Podochytrium sp. JEL0797]